MKQTHSAQFEGYKPKAKLPSLGPLIEWCWTCCGDTEHYRTTRSPKMLALGITCKVCRKKVCASSSARARTKTEKPLREAARAERRTAKLKQEAEELAARQAARVAAKFAPRWCPRCQVITERIIEKRSTKCFVCKQKRDSERAARKAAVRVAATPSGIERHVANPHLACPRGHHDWNSRGYCRTCLRLRHRWNMSDLEKATHAMWKRAKSRALAKGLPFSIDPTDCTVPPRCPVFGLFEHGTGKRMAMGPSLDRTQPDLGYVKGNVQVISSLANTIKGAWTREQLRAVADCEAIWPKAA